MAKQKPKQERSAKLERKTAETEIRITLSLDPSAEPAGGKIKSGVDFLDHMLAQLAKHGNFGLEVTCRGDTHIDDHHSVEDIGIALGQAFDAALGDKKGLVRFAARYAPLDEALSRAVVDISGRPSLSLYTQWTAARIGEFDVQLVREFFQGFANGAKLTLHLDCLRGINCHHQVESMFKSFALALKDASRVSDGWPESVPSTKGVI